MLSVIDKAFELHSQKFFSECGKNCCQNSIITTSPAQRRGSVLTWNIADLGPGEVRNIDYLARAQRSGIFASPAYIEAWAGDGAGTISAEISGQVYVPGDVPARSGSDDWQPPACFGLNCTAMGGEENWMPCLACSAAEGEMAPFDTLDEE